MPATRPVLVGAGIALLAASASVALAARTATGSERAQVRAAVTQPVAQAMCRKRGNSAADCAASVFAIKSTRIAEADPSYAWVQIAVKSGPVKDGWIADGGPWRKVAGKWKPINGAACMYTTLNKLPQAVRIDFGADFCGIAPPGVGEG